MNKEQLFPGGFMFGFGDKYGPKAPEAKWGWLPVFLVFYAPIALLILFG